MPSKCVRQLIFRWSLLMVVLTEMLWAVVGLVTNKLPVADTILMTDGGAIRGLPVVWYRFVDPLVAVIPLALLIAFGFASASIKVKCYRNSSTSAEGVFGCGMAFGVLGAIVIAVAGVYGMAFGTVISSLVILMVALFDGRILPVGSFLTEVAAVLVIWFCNTLLQGAISGLIFAGGALLLAAVVHFGAAAIGYAAYWIGPHFNRIMIQSCIVEAEQKVHG